MKIPSIESVRGVAWIGSLILAGAFAAPADGAAIVFKVEDIEKVKAFVENDPYVANRIVTEWRIREWTVVAGTAAAG